MLFSKPLTFILCTLTSITLAGPVPVATGDTLNVSANKNHLFSRSGNHRAIIYSENYCGGTARINVFNFGCGGWCYTFDGAWSILLTQDGVGNPKPTADVFSDTGCQNKVTHAGILRGDHAACTEFADVARSAYLYNNC